MPARILRWKGGYAGDMIMYLMYLSGYKIANVNFQDQISQSGRVIADFSHVNGPLSEIDRISLDQCYRDSVDHDRLVKEIRSLDDVWIKSHYYTDSFDDITTDITVDAASLPFVMSANVYKTDTLKTQTFHPLADRIKDADVKIKLVLYSVGVDSLNTTSAAVSKICVSDLLQGWQTLCAKLDLVDIHLSPKGENFYQDWYKNNQKYFAGAKYRELINKKNHCHDHKDLSIVERYALMILHGQKFQILQDQKETA